MRETTHYHLNQWNGEDRIHHDDFNRDNQRIDQAIYHHTPYTKIGSITTSHSARQVDLDVTDINWSAYKHVYLDIMPTGDHGTIYVRCNDVGSNYHFEAGNLNGGQGGVGEFNNNFARVLFFGCDTCPQVNVITLKDSGLSYGTVNSSYDVTYANLSSVNFCCEEKEDTIDAGTRISIWGVK